MAFGRRDHQQGVSSFVSRHAFPTWFLTIRQGFHGQFFDAIHERSFVPLVGQIDQFCWGKEVCIAEVCSHCVQVGVVIVFQNM